MLGVSLSFCRFVIYVSMLIQSFRDSLSPRLLPYFASDIPHDDLTVQVCIERCASLGYTSAGLEYGQECYCGSPTYPIGESTPMSECGMACLGDASQICGDRLRLLVYNHL
jgi:WSC domain